MRITFFFFLFIIHFTTVHAQKLHFAPDRATFVGHTNLDSFSYNYLLIGDTTSEKKPLLVFCQGSGVIPLFMLYQDTMDYLLLPKEIFLNSDYNYLILSKPGIPVVAKQSELIDLSYVDKESHLPPKEYLKNNNLPYYLESYTAAIDAFHDKNWVDTNRIILVGHSQGARIATKLAKNNPFVTHLVYLSADPLGRFYSYYLKKKKEGNKVEADSLKLMYDRIVSTNDRRNEFYRSESYQAWYDFSEIILDDLMELNIPVFVGYGTADPSCPNCELIYFQAKYRGKSEPEFKIMEYEGLDHNFFVAEKHPRGKHNWHQVVQDYESWLENFSRIIQTPSKPR